MAEVLLRVPDDVRREFVAVLGREIPENMWQLLFSRFLKEELKEKLARIKRIESIVSKSKLTDEQAELLSNEASLSLSKRFLKSAGVKSPKPKRSGA